MSDYNDLFKQSKGMRSLEWLSNLGSVEVEVELDEGVTKTFNVTPAQATLLVKFQEKGLFCLQAYLQTDFCIQLTLL